MYFIDNSSYYETSYSVDIKIEQQLKRKKQEEQQAENILQAQRKKEFEEYYKAKEDEIFELPALTFVKFTHIKVKFSFQPSKVLEFVSKKIIFYCTLIYLKQYNRWAVKKDTVPVGPIKNYKFKVFNIFHKPSKIEDDSLPDAILQINKYLMEWSQYEKEFRWDRYERYKRGQLEDLELQSEDEELFLSDEEREALFQKRQRILRRMIPPQKLRAGRRPRRRRVKPIELSSDSNG